MNGGENTRLLDGDWYLEGAICNTKDVLLFSKPRGIIEGL